MIARKDAWKFLKFAMVGLASTMIYFLLLAVMSEFIANILILTAVCYALSMLLNYLMQSLYTFRAGPPSRRAVSRYATMHAGALVFNSLAMKTMVDILSAPLIPSQILVMGVLAVSTFFISKLWVFG
jgi:putative flippase GtrA